MKFYTNPKFLDKVEETTEPNLTNVLMVFMFIVIFILPTINAIIKTNF